MTEHVKPAAPARAAERRGMNLPELAAQCLEVVKSRRPAVHCITNSVAEAFTANALLALGVQPSMTADAREVAAFVKSADALLVNLGTLTEGRDSGIGAALEAARGAAKPWVLDPVLIDRSPWRCERARKYLGLKPAVVRANAREVAVLVPGKGTQAVALVRRYRTVVACTGVQDIVTDGVRRVAIANGSPCMAQVTAMGCAVSAIVAAFLVAHRDALVAAASALLVAGVAGEAAGRQASGPGSFVPRFLDALATIQPQYLLSGARCTVTREEPAEPR
jgi:hydroxyethylthiazole kinase